MVCLVSSACVHSSQHIIHSIAARVSARIEDRVEMFQKWVDTQILAFFPRRTLRTLFTHKFTHYIRMCVCACVCMVFLTVKHTDRKRRSETKFCRHQAAKILRFYIEKSDFYMMHFARTRTLRISKCVMCYVMLVMCMIDVCR